jgi:predicted negative regulator of RcsB-dependent stress response
METLIVVVIAAVVGYIAWKIIKKPDVNNDGKVDAQDVVAAAKEVATEVKAGADKAVEKVKKARKPRAPKAGK